MAVRSSMNVSVTPRLERFVQDLVASGRYHSASEVFRDGLRLLEHSERRRLLEKWLVEGLTPDEQARIPRNMLGKARSRIKTMIQEGLDALDRGDTIDGDEFFARWTSLRKGASPSTTKRRLRVQRRR